MILWIIVILGSCIQALAITCLISIMLPTLCLHQCGDLWWSNSYYPRANFLFQMKWIRSICAALSAQLFNTKNYYVCSQNSILNSADICMDYRFQIRWRKGRAKIMHWILWRVKIHYRTQLSLKACHILHCIDAMNKISLMMKPVTSMNNYVKFFTSFDNCDFDESDEVPFGPRHARYFTSESGCLFLPNLELCFIFAF